MDINEATAKALQAARAVKGLTYEEVCEKSGVSIPTINRMFGAKRDIKLPQLQAVATVLGVTVVEVLQDAERIQARDGRSSLEESTRQLFGGELASGRDRDLNNKNEGGESR